MDCDKVQDLLTEYLDGGLENGEGRGVELHLRECPRCAAEEKALKETLSLLRSLPPEKAPPELREGVRKRLAVEAPKAAAGKGLFASARIRIPVEAAAAVLLFLLVYGIQRQFPAADRPAAPPVRVESPPAPAGEAVPPAEPAAASGYRTAERMEAKKGAGKSSLAASAPLPAVPATRVSTGAETVAPRAAQEDRTAPPDRSRVFAAPPSRLLRPLPYGREVILVVTAEGRPGIEERIARIAEGIGGTIHGEMRHRAAPAGEAAEASPPEGSVRVHIPSGSEESFFTELRKLGAIPPEGMPARLDLPPGPAPGVLAYTVRIRVR